MEFKDYYQILGVSSDADAKAIKTAYRKLAQKYHPDMNQDKGSEDKFKEISEAYQVLKDSTRRAEFDELRKYGNRSTSGFTPPPGWQPKQGSGFESAGASNADFSDFFNSIFGARQGFSEANFRESQTIRGQDVEIELPIFLEETLTEFKKEIEYTLNVQDNGVIKPVKKHLNVKIPLGVTDGQRIRLVGQGGPGANNGPAGDLYLHVRLVPHPLFDVSGHDLLLTVPLTPWEAALGTKVTAPTLDGKINLTIPPNSQTGKRFRVKGKGLKTRSITGDLYAIVKVVMPEKNTTDAHEHWQALAKSENFNPRTDWEVSL